ncbi:MAG: Lsm family RNA-binding protein [Candidatus Helarchaeales archaeon]
MSQTSEQRFFREISSLIDSEVKVVTTKKVYSGKLLGMERQGMSIVLGPAEDDEGNEFERIFIYGQHILEIIEMAKGFDLQALADEISKLFPKGQVQYYPDARSIVVLNKIKVTEFGVEGTGPLAESVRKVYNKFVEKIQFGPGAEAEIEEIEKTRRKR